MGGGEDRPADMRTQAVLVQCAEEAHKREQYRGVTIAQLHQAPIEN